MSVRHTRSGAGGSVAASWFLAVHGSRIFRLEAVTATREVGRGRDLRERDRQPALAQVHLPRLPEPRVGSGDGPARLTRQMPGTRLPAPEPCALTGGPWRSSPRSRAPARRRPPPRAPWALEFQGQGRGIPRPPFPSPGAIASASSFLQGSRRSHVARGRRQRRKDQRGQDPLPLPQRERGEGDDAHRVPSDAQRAPPLAELV